MGRGVKKLSDNREILFIADDFGASQEINDAIVNAHVNGVLHGACLMMGQTATAGAIELARKHPSLQIGWHLHLNDSIPCSVAAWPWGDSPARAGFALGWSGSARRFASAEISRQWQELKDTGLECRFVNAHHHLHLHPFVRRRLVKMLAEDPDFDGWIRWGTPRFFGASANSIAYGLINVLLQAPSRRHMPLRSSKTLWGLGRTFEMNAEEIIGAISRLGDGLHEFMFHPRSIGPAGVDSDTACLVELKTRFGYGD